MVLFLRHIGPVANTIIIGGFSDPSAGEGYFLTFERFGEVRIALLGTKTKVVPIYKVSSI